MKRMRMAVLAAVVASPLCLVASEATFKKDAVNDKCPMKGDDVAADKTTDITVKFCSDACKAKFEKDPGAFLAKIDKVPNTKCPVDAKAPKEIEGTLTVAFCCGNCKGTFDADQSKNISKVKPKKKK